MENEAQYKCPKCSIRYCSLKCYKSEKHVHDKNDNDKSESKCAPGGNITQETTAIADVVGVKRLEKYQYVLDDARIRELLRHNTVKFHLDKVHKILNASVGGTGAPDASMSQEMKRELAIDYLNTLRVGGVHFNEAIEEFCQIFLEILQ